MATLSGLLPLLLGVTILSASGFRCPSVCRCQLDSFPTVFNCSHRNLRAFPADIDPQINIVDLSHNSIRWLPENLEDYKELREIYLCNNRIESIQNTTFKGLKNLKIIDLADNSIRNLRRIQADTFVNNTPALLTLNLSRNKIELTGYDPTNLINSANLQTLDMSNCGLDDISDLYFLSGLHSIKYLNLAQNNLMWISGLVSTTLLHLDVSRCKLDSIHPTALASLSALESLDVSRNERFTFSTGTYSNSLKILKARSCYVRLESLKGFPNLTHVDLRNNSILSIRNNTFNNSRLIDMNLAGNNIGFNKIYPFNNLNSLEKLNLALNSIRRLDWNILSSNTNLKVLNLSNNALQSLPNFSMPSLKTLDASHCSINGLPENFLVGLTSLLYLNLSDNKLESCPNALNSTVLIELNLRFNRLSTLTNSSFAGLPKLRTLDLRGNRFTTPFRAIIFVKNTNLKTIKLTNNPWICHCDDKEFHLLHRFLAVRHIDNVLHLVCSSPSNLAGKKWQEACYDVWYPTVDESNMIQRYGVISTIVILSVGGVMIIISAVRRGFKERKLERRRREDEESRERALEIHEMMVQRELENMSRESSPEMRPGRRPRRTPSEITQPPTYEEALLMSRSQRDLLERGELYDKPEDIEVTRGRPESSADNRTSRRQDNLDHPQTSADNRTSRRHDNVDSPESSADNRTSRRHDNVDRPESSADNRTSRRHGNVDRPESSADNRTSRRQDNLDHPQTSADNRTSRRHDNVDSPESRVDNRTSRRHDNVDRPESSADNRTSRRHDNVDRPETRVDDRTSRRHDNESQSSSDSDSATESSRHNDRTS